MIAVSFAIGWWAKRKVTSTQAFFGSTALFGPLAVGLSSTAAVASAFALVGVPGIIYATGNPMTFWMLSSAAFSMAYIILGKKVRAMAEVGEVASLGDISDLRYNNNRVIKGLMSVIIFLGCIAYLAAQIQAGSELFAHLLGWEPIVAAFAIFGILTIYTAISGEVGGLLTQAFQGLVMVIAGIVIIVAFFAITGGFGNVMEAVGSVREMTGGGVTKALGPDFLNAWGTFPGTIAMAWMLIPILGTIGQPQVLTRMYALKDPKDMPKLSIYAAISHAIIGFLAVVVAYGALYLVAKGTVDPLAVADRAIFVFADEVGVIAQLLVYAAVLAAAMSSASLFLSICAGIISRDLPSALGKKIPENKQIMVSRITMFILGVVSILFSIYRSDMVAILGTFGWGTLMSGTFPVFIIGLLWKRANEKGVMAGMFASLVLNILSLTPFTWPGALPGYFNIIAISVALTVFVSLLTKKQELSESIQAVIDL
ncbi:MAG: sodium:solute symporter family transporter [Bacillota bacterium]